MKMREASALKIGDVLVESYGPLILDEITAIEWPEQGSPVVVARLNVKRHAYGRVVDTHYWIGIESEQIVWTEPIPIDETAD